MELSEADFKELFPRKMGTVKKLLRVQKTVCMNDYVCMYIYVYVLQLHKNMHVHGMKINSVKSA